MDFLGVPWGNSDLVFPMENGLGFSLQASRRERPWVRAELQTLKTQPQKLHGGTSTTVHGSVTVTKLRFPHGIPPHIFLTQSLCIVFTAHVPPSCSCLAQSSPLLLPGWATSHCKKGRHSTQSLSCFAFSLALTPSHYPLMSCLKLLIMQIFHFGYRPHIHISLFSPLINS